MSLEIQINADYKRPAFVPEFSDGGHRIYKAEDRDCASATASLDGVDVTDRCMVACPGDGWVNLVVLDAAGHIQADEDQDVKFERVYGVVAVKIKGSG